MDDKTLGFILRELTAIREEVKELKDAHAKTQDLFSRAKGALYVISAIGASLLALSSFWHDLLARIWP